ncbi:dolichyl-phosphate-mannose--protein mannosyltransferase [Brevibacterium moorei]|uniref:dolichyl-phosphate-mannose--protein mannosyltransferase n=1 Tax=Brevibacterium moorei TaxID=2968457 RepID=UPI00211BCC9B|nr:phospholipid carrier-dependent glycosyltransferase [Brevibacterium sp. 68QC2CO]
MSDLSEQQTQHAPGAQSAATESGGPRAGGSRGGSSGVAARLHAALLRPGVAFYAWFIPVVLTVLGGALRLYRLGFPHSLVFDETYYVKDGYALWQSGYERNWTKEANDAFNQGDPSGLLEAGEYVVHPPLGKWLIGAGEQIFGVQSSFGWRFAAAVFGALSIFILARLAIRLFKSVWLGSLAGLLLAVDGEHFVHSRTSLLDLFVMFFVLLGFAFLLIDKEWADLTLARRLGLEPADPGARPGAVSRFRALASGLYRTAFLPGPQDLGSGPGLGWRPWRIAAGLSLGCAMGVKWSGIYVLAVFGILTVLWDLGRRRRAGLLGRWRGWFFKDAIPAFVSLVPVALIVYVLCWSGWIFTSGGYGRDWAEQNSGWWSGLPDWLVSLAHYHYTAYKFHVGLDSEHPYMSNPWGWIVQWRPTSFYYKSPELGEAGCAVDHCSAAITSVGNPVIWGLAPIAVLGMLFVWIVRRDWRTGAILAGLLAAWGPWFTYQHRTIFTFYTIVMVPFVVLAVVYLLGVIWGDADRVSTGRRGFGSGFSGSSLGSGARFAVSPRALFWRRMAVGLIVALAVLAFAFFYPVYTGETIPYEDWRHRMFNASWI